MCGLRGAGFSEIVDLSFAYDGIFQGFYGGVQYHLLLVTVQQLVTRRLDRSEYKFFDMRFFCAPDDLFFLAHVV